MVSLMYSYINTCRSLKIVSTFSQHAQGGRSYGGIEHGVSLVDALDDYPHSQRFSLIPHYGACLKNMLNTAIGFVVEALERRSLKLAINILTQIVSVYCVCVVRVYMCVVNYFYVCICT